MQNFSFMKMHLKISLMKWWPFCLGNELKENNMMSGFSFSFSNPSSLPNVDESLICSPQNSDLLLYYYGSYGEKLIQWCHNEHDGISNHQPHDCLLNCLFGHRSKKTSKLCIIGLCAGNSPVTGEFPTQRANNAENVSIWWRYHVRVEISVAAVIYAICYIGLHKRAQLFIEQLM